jgi:hypothetical protein
VGVPALRGGLDLTAIMLRISQAQALNYRLRMNNLSRRLPASSYVEAAYVGLQDTAPRDALLGMPVRVAGCEPSAWEHPRLIQTYSPRRCTSDCQFPSDRLSGMAAQAKGELSCL